MWHKTDRTTSGFTLLELLVSMTVLVILAMVLLHITDSVSRTTKREISRANTFQQARNAFAHMGRQIAQATLNTYHEYYDKNERTLGQLDEAGRAAFTPARYGRYSELHFVSGPAKDLLPSGTVSPWSGISGYRPTHGIFFTAPLGYAASGSPGDKLEKLINAAGYYVEFNSDAPDLPDFIESMGKASPRWRYRLMQMYQPAEDLKIYDPADLAQPNAWFQKAVGASSEGKFVRPIAENIIALVVDPRLATPGSTSQPLTDDFLYDSRDLANKVTRHQLPPTLKLTLIAVDEDSAGRWARLHGENPPPYLPKTLFVDPDDFQNDLAEAEDYLSKLVPKVNFRIFSVDLPIAGAKWSAAE